MIVNIEVIETVHNQNFNILNNSIIINGTENLMVPTIRFQI
jgi:hypothetical protein